MPGATKPRMCVCCGEYYFVLGEVKTVEDKLCAACVIDLNEMDGPEFYCFIADAEKVMREVERQSRLDGMPYNVEELISVMDH